MYSICFINTLLYFYRLQNNDFMDKNKIKTNKTLKTYVCFISLYWKSGVKQYERYEECGKGLS